MRRGGGEEEEDKDDDEEEALYLTLFNPKNGGTTSQFYVHFTWRPQHYIVATKVLALTYLVLNQCFI